jgi:SAM-dependent methyltransferase
VDGYDDATYGDRWADIYDGRMPASFPGELEFLFGLARNGRALELGVGTGRVAIPLAERGIDVVGIDASERMLDTLRAKTDRVRAVRGSIADVTFDGSFELVYIVFNTFFALRTQEEQVRCFANVAPRLAPDGVFVIQAFVPDPTLFDRGQRLSTVRVGNDDVEIDASVHDRATQTVRTQKIFAGPNGIELRPVQTRYAWPAELDLMAKLAGLSLRERFTDFERRPFDASSNAHVSVYGKG